MAFVSKITSKGQTTIPAELRAELGLSPGDTIRYVRDEDGSYRIVKLSGTFEDLRGMIKLDRPVSMDEILEAVDAARMAIGGGGDRS